MFIRNRLIIGPNPQDNVYLERHTHPAITNAFSEKIHARVIRNDGLFNAALVGLGSFGFIHGIVVEVEELFLLKRYVKKIDKQLALQLSKTMDFSNSAFTIPGEIDALGKPRRPYHYKVFINPYTSSLLSEEMCKVFSNPFLDTLGLSDYEEDIPKDLIASLLD